MEQNKKKSIIYLRKNLCYDITALLGEGSFGKVYKAKYLPDGDRTSEELIAIKKIPKCSLNSDFFIEHFLNEVNILQAVRSEHVVACKEVLQDDAFIYIIMELCEGGTLFNIIKNDPSLNEEKATEITKQIASVFVEQEQSFMHRDLKPENILFHNGQVKIADFGFAKAVDSDIAAPGTFCGTTPYKSPQILENKKYGRKCDVWSTGIILFCMLFKKLPWSGKDNATVLKKIKEEPLDFSKLEISEKLKDLLKKMLEVDEAKRLSWEQVYNHPALKNEPLNNPFDRFKKKYGDHVPIAHGNSEDTENKSRWGSMCQIF